MANSFSLGTSPIRLLVMVQSISEKREILESVMVALPIVATETLQLMSSGHLVIKMDHWSGAQRHFPVKVFYKNNNSVETGRARRISSSVKFRTPR